MTEREWTCFDVLIPPVSPDDRPVLGGINVHVDMDRWALPIAFSPGVSLAAGWRHPEFDLVLSLGPLNLDAWVRPNPWR